jgi:hypothetical protein
LALVVGGLVTRAALHGALPEFGFWAAPFAEPAWITRKADLPPMALLHALALAWLVARFVPREAGWMHRAAGAWLATIGRHSLEVFCLGLFLAWGATALLAQAPGSWALDLGLTVAGALVLGAWARSLGGRGKQRGAVVRESAAVRP